ncbi:hypothetical protein ACFYTQ_33275 [Nocardia sp. NPDC004068]|uniref:hypothetical protein n=1 Tax=Nocardia sp. NPDC004068 TaxID=3364303 RepID=UPI00368861E1
MDLVGIFTGIAALVTASSMAVVRIKIAKTKASVAEQVMKNVVPADLPVVIREVTSLLAPHRPWARQLDSKESSDTEACSPQ